jgi:hypothetical protein
MHTPPEPDACDKMTMIGTGVGSAIACVQGEILPVTTATHVKNLP